ncbi:hypothetical protein [Propionivibrio dicarboxylicus]|uniref:YtkA-like n=1 Tax=Propionivibrio dicarboxylicus TaxID=83767 RepID=A0A1G8JEN5_9RHOO|nr:hypothetical protein [Propionivibrio dicarboxylicus]SDI29718.1 hypothetical protein SAMN05660652_03190 [Propionivibrio dicarboxylicus]
MDSDRFTPLRKHRLPALALLLAVACSGVIAFKFAASRPGNGDQALTPQRCDPAAERCATTLPDGSRMTLSMTPNPVRPLVPLQLHVTLDETPAERVEVVFTGVHMDMGEQRAPLAGDGRQFDGQAMLPICTTGAMTWAATVRLTRRGGTLAIPFHFDVAARGPQ